MYDNNLAIIMRHLEENIKFLQEDVDRLSQRLETQRAISRFYKNKFRTAKQLIHFHETNWSQ